MEGNDSLVELWASSDVTKRYLNLLNSNYCTDVSFLVGREKRKVACHSGVLTLCSWDFHNIFKLLKLDSYVFIIQDVEYSSFMGFLEFCYTLKLDLGQKETMQRALEILKLGQRFHIQSLVQFCEQHISTAMQSKNCMLIYKYREIFAPNSEVLLRVFTEFKNYFSCIIQVPENIEIFIELPLDAIREIAKLNPINCDEMEMFDVLMKWARKACEKEGIPPSARNLRVILKDVFYEIRFPAMKNIWFFSIIPNYIDMFTKDQIVRICKRISGIMTHCLGFRRQPRTPVERVHKTFPFGHSIELFSGVPDMDNGTTKQMNSTVSFEGETKILKGFAFVAKKDEEVNVTSFKFSNGSVKNMSTYIAGRSKFNWDYDIITFRFDKNILFKDRTYYAQLICECDRYVPNLSSKHTIPKLIVRNNVYFEDNTPNAIPYLIFK